MFSATTVTALCGCADHTQPATRFSGNVPQVGTINAAPLDKILGNKGDTQGGVVKYTIGREGTMHGVKVGGSMGLTTWAAFTGTDELAAVDGDFIMKQPKEVQPVLKALRKAKIHIVALHNHMIGEHPAYYFTHFRRLHVKPPPKPKPFAPTVRAVKEIVPQKMIPKLGSRTH